MDFDADTPLDSLVPSESNFLTKEDAGENGLNLTIKGFKRDTVGSGPDADERTICYWEEDAKPMVVNKTNMGRIAHITQGKTVRDAVGKRVNVFNDPFVEFGGKMTGGLRIRPVQDSAQPSSGASFNDDVPFAPKENW